MQQAALADNEDLRMRQAALGDKEETDEMQQTTLADNEKIEGCSMQHWQTRRRWNDVAGSTGRQ